MSDVPFDSAQCRLWDVKAEGACPPGYNMVLVCPEDCPYHIPVNADDTHASCDLGVGEATEMGCERAVRE